MMYSVDASTNVGRLTVYCPRDNTVETFQLREDEFLPDYTVYAQKIPINENDGLEFEQVMS